MREYLESAEKVIGDLGTDVKLGLSAADAA